MLRSNTPQAPTLRSNPVNPTAYVPGDREIATERVGSPVAVRPSGGGRFAIMPDMSHEEASESRTREYLGDGTSFLRVPGCLGIEEIRIGNMPLPLSEQRTYPTSATGGFITVDEPLVAFQVMSDGTPMLVRAVISNDGIWQRGAHVFVTGEWDGEDDEQSKYERLHPDKVVLPQAQPNGSGNIAEIVAAVVAAMSLQNSVPNVNHGGVQTDDMSVREQVARDTGSTEAMTIEGSNPTLVPDAKLLQDPDSVNEQFRVASDNGTGYTPQPGVDTSVIEGLGEVPATPVVDKAAPLLSTDPDNSDEFDILDDLGADSGGQVAPDVNTRGRRRNRS